MIYGHFISAPLSLFVDGNSTKLERSVRPLSLTAASDIHSSQFKISVGLALACLIWQSWLHHEIGFGNSCANVPLPRSVPPRFPPGIPAKDCLERRTAVLAVSREISLHRLMNCSFRCTTPRMANILRGRRRQLADTCWILSFILFNIPNHAVVRCRDSSPSNSEERDALNVSGATYITCRPIHTYHTCTRSVDIHDWEWRLASLRGIASILLPSLIFTCAAEPGSVRHRLHRRLHQYGAYFRFQIPMPLQSSTRYAL